MKSQSLLNVINSVTANSGVGSQKVGNAHQEHAADAGDSSENTAQTGAAAAFNVKFLLWNAVSRVMPDFSGQKMVGSCNGCGNCCRASKCKFLAEREGGAVCTIYHHPLRKLLNCASYPANQRAVTMVNCTGFKFVRNKK